jgi:tripartite-type tricarboxylate transporter receptor subunit TctC
LLLGAWRGVVGPAGLPKDIATQLEAAIKEIYESQQFQEAMTSRGFGLLWRNSSDFKAFMENETTNVQAVIKALGL